METIWGSVVSIDGRGVLLRGPSGVGKSDLALRLLDLLKSPYREVVALRYVQSLTIDEISDRLQRPAGTVRCQLKRGLDRVRSCVEGRGMELPERVA